MLYVIFLKIYYVDSYFIVCLSEVMWRYDRDTSFITRIVTRTIEDALIYDYVAGEYIDLGVIRGLAKTKKIWKNQPKVAQHDM